MTCLAASFSNKKKRMNELPHKKKFFFGMKLVLEVLALALALALFSALLESKVSPASPASPAPPASSLSLHKWGPLSQGYLHSVPYSERFQPPECLGTAFALAIVVREIMHVHGGIKSLAWEEADVGMVDSLARVRVVNRTARACMRAVFPPDRAEPWMTSDSWLRNQVVMRMLYDAGLHIDTVSFGEVGVHQKLLWYSAGGQFVEHVDRKQGPSHIGTLLLILNSEDLHGGVLQVNGEGVVDQPGVWLVFLPLGVPHGVSPVERGERHVFTAPVFGEWVDASVPEELGKRAPYRPYED